MGIVEVGVDGKRGLSFSFRVLGGWVERLVGLLGTRADAMPVVLLRCASIHTYGMGYPIDVAFVDQEGRVLLSRRSLPPRRLLSSKDAFCVFERPASDAPWIEEGDRLFLASLGYAGCGTEGREEGCYA